MKFLNKFPHSLFLIFLCVFTVCSCIDETKTSDFKINMDLVMKENDSLHVFYTTDGTINFNEKQSFWTKVNGADKNQSVILTLPRDTVPKQLRIDFGQNRKQSDVILNKIEFYYLDNSFEIEGKEIYNYFRVDESYTVLDKKLGLLKRKQALQANGPSLYPNGDKLKSKLAEVTTAKKN